MGRHNKRGHARAIHISSLGCHAMPCHVMPCTARARARPCQLQARPGHGWTTSAFQAPKRSSCTNPLTASSLPVTTAPPTPQRHRAAENLHATAGLPCMVTMPRHGDHATSRKSHRNLAASFISLSAASHIIPSHHFHWLHAVCILDLACIHGMGHACTCGTEMKSWGNVLKRPALCLANAHSHRSSQRPRVRGGEVMARAGPLEADKITAGAYT